MNAKPRPMGRELGAARDEIFQILERPQPKLRKFDVLFVSGRFFWLTL